MNKSELFKAFLLRKVLVSVFCIIGFLSLGTIPSRAEAEAESERSILAAIQQNRVTLDITAQSIKYILDEINRQANINFLLRQEKEINADMPNLSIKVTDATVSETLDKLFNGTNYTYVLDENTVIVLKRSEQTARSGQPRAQTFELKGRVLDAENGDVIAGATIICTGRNAGTTSDANGRFSLNVSVGDVIEVRFLGKITQTHTIANNEPITVTLRNDVMLLDDVVLTGYGSVNRDSYTGNAVTIRRDELLNVSKTNVIDALQAFDPSFRIQENNQWGSDPNAMPEVQIRGGSSLGSRQATFNDDGSLAEHTFLQKGNLETNPNLPTFIMDGFEIGVSKLYDFDPNRIESVTILKDAAATALYGSRAANGVVVITTVAPKPGQLSVNYSFLAEITAPDLSDYNLLNAREKLEVERLAGCYTYDPNDMTLDNYWELVEEYDAKLYNVQRGVDTYWLSKPLQTQFNHKHTIDIEGGTDNFRYGIDLQHYGQGGVMKESFRDRTGIGLTLQYNYKGLSFKNYVSYSRTDAQNSPYGKFSDYAKQLPYDTYLDDDGSVKQHLLSWTLAPTPKINPLYEPSLHNFDRSNDETFTNRLVVNWKLAKDLLWTNQLNLEKSFGKTEIFYDPQSLKNETPLSLTVLSSGELRNGYSDSFTYNYSSFMSYFLYLGDHSLNARAGFEIRENSGGRRQEFYRGFPSGLLSSPNDAREQVEKTGYMDFKTRDMGFHMGLNYSLKDIYLLDLSMRMDGSSSFGADKRIAPFWSTGVGINVHNYEFMQDNEVIEQLKIRGSYGQVGNSRFESWDALMTYTVLNDDWYKTGYGAILRALGNSNLKWETTNIFDVGFELTMLRNRVHLTATYYNKKTVDTINDVTLPISTGFQSYKDNVGEIRNRGFELGLRVTAIQTNDMQLYINANMAQNRNKILKISDSMREYNKKVQDMYNISGVMDYARAVPLLQYYEGGSEYSIWGVRSLGIDPADGQEVFVQRDGRLTKTWNTTDQVVIGNTEPTARGSLGFNFRYKRLSVVGSFLYEFGGQRYNQTLVDKVENADVYSHNVDRRVLTDRWQKEGDHAMFKSLVAGRLGVQKTRPTSRFVQDYNMISMQSFEVGYDMPRGLVEKLGLKMVRISAGMNDVFQLSSVKQERGIDYPYAREFHLSARLSF